MLRIVYTPVRIARFMLLLVLLVSSSLLFVTSNTVTIEAQTPQTNNTNNQGNVVNLLDENNFIWKSVWADVRQDNDTLDITVETDRTDKTYNRAYVQTQLNVSQAIPLLLTLDYAAQSFEGDADFIVDVRNISNPRDHDINYLSPSNTTVQTGGLTSEKFILENITNKPIEIRFYIITEEPGSHILAVDRALVSSAINTTNNENDNVGTSRNGTAWNLTATSIDNNELQQRQERLHPFFWLLRG